MEAKKQAGGEARTSSRMETRTPLRTGEKHVLFATLLRRSEAFDSAMPLIDYEEIANHDRMYAVAWQVAYDHHAEHEELPELHELQAGLQRFFSEDPEALSKEERGNLAQFIAFMFSVDREKLKPRVALKYLKRYLEDRLADEVRSALTGYTPMNIQELLVKAVARTEELSMADARDVALPFEDDWLEDNAHLELRDTGVDFINHFTGDDDGAGFGHGCTESFGLLGPFGGGKTTTGIMLSTLGSKLAFDAWRANERQGPLRLSYQFSWEEPKQSLRIRALCFLAQIPRKTLVTAIRAKDMRANLSCSTSLKDYERERWAHRLRSGARVAGEYERFQKAKAILNATWRVIDLTGNDKEAGHTGSGLVDEVAAIIRRDQQRTRDTETGVQVVVVDYVGAAAERYIDAQGLDHGGNLRHIINRWPLHMKNKVGVPFFCPTWSLHQLSTTANTGSPGNVPKYTDAAEGKAFAENLDFCFMFGLKTKQSHMVVTCNKARREAAREERVVHLDGEFQIVRDADETHILRNRKIVTRAEDRGLQGGADPAVPTDDAGGVVPSDIESQNRSLRPRRRRTNNITGA